MTFLEALRSYETFSGRLIRRAWEKILWPFPHSIRVLIIHYMVVSRESDIIKSTIFFQDSHSHEWRYVMTELKHCTLALYFSLGEDTDITEESRLYHEDDFWSICIDYDVCDQPHKLKKRRIQRNYETYPLFATYH